MLLVYGQQQVFLLYSDQFVTKQQQHIYIFSLAFLFFCSVSNIFKVLFLISKITIIYSYHLFQCSIQHHKFHSLGFDEHKSRKLENRSTFHLYITLRKFMKDKIVGNKYMIMKYILYSILNQDKKVQVNFTLANFIPALVVWRTPLLWYFETFQQIHKNLHIYHDKQLLFVGRCVLTLCVFYPYFHWVVYF